MRSKKAKIRSIGRDGKYNSELVMRFTNLLMRDGKKEKAIKIVHKVLSEYGSEVGKDALEAFTEVLDKARPSSILKPRRLGGSNVQIPVAVDRSRGLVIVMRWIIAAARKRKGAAISVKLLKELVDINAGVGDVLKKRDDVHKMAEANKAFAYIR